MVVIHIGFDDTDSPRGGCTTYIAALLAEELGRLGATFIDYPNLIRLNPNVPWKTRGNGALCLRIDCDESITSHIFEAVADIVEENSDLGFEDTDPGIVFLKGAKIPEEVKVFAKKTIRSIVRMDQALTLIKKYRAEALGFGTGYGIIGALGAIGETLEGDHTYEVIAYRTPENRGMNRQIDPSSIVEMDRKTKPQTFNNIDPETRRILITPRGPDPILYAIRGETPKAVVRAQKLVRNLEPIERWVIFRTNHGTDAHLKEVRKIGDIQPYHPIIATGTVTSLPKVVPRRHRIFTIKDATGMADCAAYEPTGNLRKIASQLIPGDIVEVYGGVRPSTMGHRLTVNLEKLRILKLASKMEFKNPRCPDCGAGMGSMGKGQGLRCPKCGFRSASLQKLKVEKKRDISEGLYITSLRSQRHLTKPLSRYGIEKTGKPAKMIARWHNP